MSTQRPVTVTSAIVLLTLLSVFSALAGVMPAAIKPPPFQIYSGLVLGIGGLIAVFGLWSLKRWGWQLTILISVVSSLLAAPGLVLAPPVLGKVVSLGLTVLYALVVVLVVLPASRKAFAH
ncbi:MAG: hypothetical protein NVSMB44_43950 [Ktedonobacteraceae bacterium]